MTTCSTPPHVLKESFVERFTLLSVSFDMSASVHESSSRSPLVPGREHSSPSPTAQPPPSTTSLQESSGRNPRTQVNPFGSGRADNSAPRRFIPRIPVPELTYQSLSTPAIPMEWIATRDITDNHATSEVSDSPVSLRRLRSVGSSIHDDPVLPLLSPRRQQSADPFQFSATPPGTGATNLTQHQADAFIGTEIEVPLVTAGGSGTNTAYTLSRKRMAALAEVDSALFS